MPLLLIDVDGVLSLYGGPAPETIPAAVDGIPHFLSRPAAAVLVELAPDFECVWCTGWKDRADMHLPALLGVPRGWPHLTFPEGGAHWKLAGIDAFAGPDRPLAWIDDDHDDECRAWAASRPARLCWSRPDPWVGLTAEHAQALRRWLTEA